MNLYPGERVIIIYLSKLTNQILSLLVQHHNRLMHVIFGLYSSIPSL